MCVLKGNKVSIEKLEEHRDQSRIYIDLLSYDPKKRERISKNLPILHIVPAGRSAPLSAASEISY